MAATGIVLLGFVCGHLAGNLLIFVGPEALDGIRSISEIKTSSYMGSKSGSSFQSYCTHEGSDITHYA